MSDPLKTAELEDVLSSIRRLVTEQAEARVPGASRLVLTPALRIDAGTAPNLAEPEDAALAEPESDDDITSPEAPDADHPGAPTLEDRLAELEAAVADTPLGAEAPEPPTSTAAAASVRATRLHIRLPEDPSYEDETSAPDSAPDPAGTATRAWARPRPEPEDSRATEPDADESDDPLDLFAAGEDTVLDEETLRRLVGEIVREELQGALGERITRNVRKLVRREINRVLASRDFD